MSEQLPLGAKPSKKAKPAAWSEARCLAAIRERYPKREYALLPQVKNATGFARRERYADALVMSLWPSRGLELMGFEVKSARSDWLRELAEPDKAEEIARFCDRWWIVAGSQDIIEEGELPPTWGLLVPEGNSLIVAVQAPKLTPQPLSLPFIASMLRTAQEHVTSQGEIERAVAEAVQQEQSAQLERLNAAREEARKVADRQYQELLDRVQAFEKASGVSIDHFDGTNVGNTYRLAQEIRWDNGRLYRAKSTFADLLELIEAAEKEIGGLKQSGADSRAVQS